METLLYIGQNNLPPKSARNCKQELKIIDTSITKRTINGDLIKLRGSKKLWTRITCADQKIPEILDLELGSVIQIGCIQRLWKKVTPGTEVTLKHTPCAKSVMGHDGKGKMLCFCHPLEKGDPVGPQDFLGSRLRGNDNQRTIHIPPNVEFISYRPWLDIMVTKVETNYHEWDMTASWLLEGEEV